MSVAHRWPRLRGGFAWLAAGLLGALVAVAAPPVASADEPFQLTVPVLTYHRILCPAPDTLWPALFICPDDLTAQMALLQRRGWHTITADDLAEALLAHTCLPRKTFVITIDDARSTCDEGHRAGHLLDRAEAIEWRLLDDARLPFVRQALGQLGQPATMPASCSKATGGRVRPSSCRTLIRR